MEKQNKNLIQELDFKDNIIIQSNDSKLNIENNLEHYKKISQEKDGEINE